MTTVRMALAVTGQGASVELDEEFFHLVDRAGLARKQGDPHRLDEVQRAAQEEARLAHLGGGMREDRSRQGDRI
jgi:hypothetical protein